MNVWFLTLPLRFLDGDVGEMTIQPLFSAAPGRCNSDGHDPIAT